MQGAQMKFELRESGRGVYVLTCHGGLSWEDRELLTACVERSLECRGGARGLVLDLREVAFVNSAGLGALLQLERALRQRGTRLAVAHTPTALRRLFRAVGMERTVPSFESVAAATTFLSQCRTPAQSAERGRNGQAHGADGSSERVYRVSPTFDPSDAGL